MDLESYNKIMGEILKSEDPSTPKRKSRGGFTPGEISFKKDLLRGKIVWYNDKKKDWKAYIRMNHPAISICGVPKQHPFGKVERFIAFLIDFGLSAMLSYIVSVITPVIFGTTYYDDGYSPTPAPTPSPEIWEIDTEYILYGQLLSLGGAVIITISNGCVKTCATCACCQKNSCPKCCRKLFECIGGCLMCIWFLVVLFMCFSFGLLAWYENVFTTFMLNFAGERVWSWITSFVMMRICFNKKWKKEKANKGKKLNKLKVTYIDYELYVNGNQVEHPPNYRPNRKSTIGSIGSEADGRTSTASPTTPSNNVIYVEQVELATTNVQPGNKKRPVVIINELQRVTK